MIVLAGAAPAQAQTAVPAGAAASVQTTLALGAGTSRASSVTVKTASVRASLKKSYGSFQTKTVKRQGDDIIKLPKGAKSGIVTITHSGDSNFAVKTLTAEGQWSDLLVNEIGDYSGTVAFNLSRRDKPRYLEIVADGSWKVTIKPVYKAKALPKSSKGDGVFTYSAKFAERWSIKHKGDSNFAVRTYGGRYPDLLINEIGRYSGRKLVARDVKLVEVFADGTWSVKR